FTLNLVDGGALGLGYGGVLMNQGAATISASTFSSNKATGGGAGGPVYVGFGSGGAISNQSTGVLSVTGSTFTNNGALDGLGARAEGGAIDNRSGASLTLGGDSFQINHVTASAKGGYGGAVANVQATLIAAAGCT